MIRVLFQDKHIIVCLKPIGVLSESGMGRMANMPELLKKFTNSYKIDVIHRLDKPIGGVMVFSKNARATNALSKQILSHKVVKEYLAVVFGCPQKEKGEMFDILFKDSKNNKSYVVSSARKGTKEALLYYETLKTVDTEKGKLSLVKVKLYTGRTHQIRVQFSSRKMPLLGDTKYGGKDNCDIALWSYHLAFEHPVYKTMVDITENPPQKYPWNLFNIK